MPVDDNCHQEKMWSPHTFLKGDHLKTIPPKFALNLPSSGDNF